MKQERIAKLELISAMVVFGTIGVFRRYIPVSSSILAMTRGFIGSLVLVFVIACQKKKFSFAPIRRNLLVLCLSGGCIGINWILLFESYRYTSVATATLCYYMAPIFVIVASPLLLKERLPVSKILCVIVALAGMVCVSGVLSADFSFGSEFKGVILGIGAAVFYATVILLNKKLRDISAYEKTVMQLASATIVVMPYVLFTEKGEGISMTPFVIIMMLVVGVIHTGLAYTLYFGSMKDLKAQTVALFSYIDPVVAILLSAVLLKERMEVLTIIGAILVLGSTVVSDMLDSKESNRKQET